MGGPAGGSRQAAGDCRARPPRPLARFAAFCHPPRSGDDGDRRVYQRTGLAARRHGPHRLAQPDLRRARRRCAGRRRRNDRRLCRRLPHRRHPHFQGVLGLSAGDGLDRERPGGSRTDPPSRAPHFRRATAITALPARNQLLPVLRALGSGQCGALQGMAATGTRRPREFHAALESLPRREALAGAVLDAPAPGLLAFRPGRRASGPAAEMHSARLGRRSLSTGSVRRAARLEHPFVGGDEALRP